MRAPAFQPRLQDNLNPEFATPLVLTYHFERRQALRFGIYDIDNASETVTDDDFVGEFKCRSVVVMSVCRSQPVVVGGVEVTVLPFVRLLAQFNRCFFGGGRGQPGRHCRIAWRRDVGAAGQPGAVGERNHHRVGRGDFVVQL